ncbi:tRNA pseudouridine(55) synthase TruB [Patescibacteria group bacterium]|nr:tRNA pseudouridine(55) synthase TruB [Patescibacteria group bacterium]
MRHGFLLINKPVGPSSHDCVAMVRKTLMERKIGHLGTLDPAADGLLVLAVGAKALKVVELYKDLTKEYEAQIHFGAVSSTYDREGVIEEVTLKPGVPVPDQTAIQNIIVDHFLGKIDQVPPGYSAIKVGGERAYRKMRQGRGVDLPPREVEITDCDLISYDYPDLKLHVGCSSGTYIRSLAHDLGNMLRCGGYLAGLKRTKVGDWSVEDSVALDKVKWTDVIPLKEVLADFPRIDLTEEEYYDIRNGRDIDQEVKPDTFGWFEGLPIAILIPEDGKTHARKVL